MTIADKTEIDGLLNSAKELKDCVTTANKPYHDDKIAQYAASAISDAKEVKAFIKAKVQNNIELFFDCEHMELSYFGSNSWLKLRNGELLAYTFGDFEMSLTVTDNILNFTTSSFSTTPESIEVWDVWAHTSDTNRPDYRICSAKSFVYGAYPYEALLSADYPAQKWAEIRNAADATKRKTEFLVRAFKEALTKRIALFKGRANAAIAAKERNEGVGEYQKVAV